MAMVLDQISLGSQRVRTPEGFLRAPAVIGRAGVLSYQPSDPAVATAPAALLSAGRPIRILRPESSVFDPESMASFAGRPILNEHSTGKVDSSNYRDHIAGAVGSQIVRDGDLLRADLTIYDTALIAAIDAGKDQLSQGYDAPIAWDSGIDPKHGAFDGVFGKIIGNHVAVTLAGRSGSEVRIMDSTIEGVKMAKRSFKGIEVDIPETMVSVIDSYFSDAAKTAADLNEANGKIAALAKQIDESKAEIARVTDSTFIDNAVKERAALVETAKKIAPAVVCDSLTNDAIRAAAVAARGIKVEGVDATRGAFIALASASIDAAPVVAVADALKAGAAPVETPEMLYNKARAEYTAAQNKRA